MNRFDSFSSFSEKVPCRSEWPYLRPVIFLEKVWGHLVSNFAISGNVSHYENAHISIKLIVEYYFPKEVFES